MNTVYQEVTALLLATAALGFIALRLKQPVIVAYILIGIWPGRPCSTGSVRTSRWSCWPKSV